MGLLQDPLASSSTPTIAAFFAGLVALIYLLGIFSAVHAVMNSRSSQGAIAWSLSLITAPYIALPFYWMLARDKFFGYHQLFRSRVKTSLHESEVEIYDKVIKEIDTHRVPPEKRTSPTISDVFEEIAQLPLTDKNHVELLIDADQTFYEMLHSIEKAQDYICMFAYIISSDQVGEKFQKALLTARERDVRVYLVYDEVGSLHLSQDYINVLVAAGCIVKPFFTTQGFYNKFQINFRNHRKILVVDGEVAFAGGVNISDDSLGLNPHYGPWRDTHLKVEGPVVQQIQLVFCEDYHWAASDLPKLNWDAKTSSRSNMHSLYLAHDPIDDYDRGVLFFLHTIQSAKKRVWLASPYFVPDDAVMSALVMASMRGVEVKILLPSNWDYWVVYMTAFSYLPEIARTNIEVYRYQGGYTHQKVALIDDEWSWVGSSNMDNRSMRLNFEGNLIVQDPNFGKSVETMLLKDIENCTPVGIDDYSKKPLLFQIGVQISRLFAPIL